MLDGDFDFDLWEPSRFLDFDWRVGVAEALDLPDFAAPFLLARSLFPPLSAFPSFAAFPFALLLLLVPCFGSFLLDLALLADLLDFSPAIYYSLIQFKNYRFK